MSALVVYESAFGSTQEVARMVADGIDRHVDVTLCEVGVAPASTAGLELVVVGAPTHAFSLTLSLPGPRQDAAAHSGGGTDSSAEGIREWLDGLTVERRIPAAAFTTVLQRPRVLHHHPDAGSAAARRLRRLGLDLVMAPADFLVQSTTGPLVDGEAGRAWAWGERLGRVCQAVAAGVGHRSG